MMKVTAWVVVVMLVAIAGVFLLGKGGLTGQATGSIVSFTNGTILSVIAGIIAIGVLIVAGLQQSKT